MSVNNLFLTFLSYYKPTKKKRYSVFSHILLDNYSCYKVGPYTQISWPIVQPFHPSPIFHLECFTYVGRFPIAILSIYTFYIHVSNILRIRKIIP